MIRIATEADVPAILEIYAPYVLKTTASFEYDVPCRKEFLQRFYTITAQFPWLVWEEDCRILGYAYASPPFSGRLTAGAQSLPSTCAPIPREPALPKSFTPPWNGS